MNLQETLVKLSWRRYFHADRNSIFALPFFLIFIVTFKRLWKDSSNMIVYLLTMMFIMAVYAYNKKALFLGPYFPFMAILFVKGANLLFKNENKKLIHKICIVLFYLYFPAATVLLSIRTVHQYRSNILENNLEIANTIGEHNRVMVDERFVFPEIKNQDYIVNIMQFMFFRSFHGFKPYGFNELIDESVRRDLDYFVIRYSEKNMFLKDIKDNDLRYKITFQNKDCIVFKINK